MNLENARLHIYANGDFPAIGDSLESLPKLTHTLREHCLYSLRVAKERPHRKWDHRTRVRCPGENAVVSHRPLSDPVYISGERLDFVRCVILGADGRRECRDLAIGDEIDCAALYALGSSRRLHRRPDNSIYVAQALYHRSRRSPTTLSRRLPRRGPVHRWWTSRTSPATRGPRGSAA